MGVIVARFQTPYLTSGHRELIETVRARHKKFAIVLGIARVIPSRNNPLDFTTRHVMIQEAYPGTEVLSIFDTPHDTSWSNSLDNILRLLHPHEKIVLYGGRDSFIDHYFGKFSTVELASNVSESGTQARQEAFHEIRDTEDFRRGICYATANQYRKSVPTVDVAVERSRPDCGPKNCTTLIEVLLAHKNEDGEGKWRFIGGHIDVGKESAEQAGRREVTEESGTSCHSLKYITSCPIDDWRYRGTGDSIFTTFFAATYGAGPSIAADDVDSVRWFDLKDLNEKMMVDTHHVLLDAYLRYKGLRGTIEYPGQGYEVTKATYDTVNGEQVITSIQCR